MTDGDINFISCQKEIICQTSCEGLAAWGGKFVGKERKFMLSHKVDVNGVMNICNS